MLKVESNTQDRMLFCRAFIAVMMSRGDDAETAVYTCVDVLVKAFKLTPQQASRAVDDAARAPLNDKKSRRRLRELIAEFDEMLPMPGSVPGRFEKVQPE